MKWCLRFILMLFLGCLPVSLSARCEVTNMASFYSALEKVEKGECSARHFSSFENYKNYLKGLSNFNLILFTKSAQLNFDKSIKLQNNSSSALVIAAVEEADVRFVGDNLKNKESGLILLQDKVILDRITWSSFPGAAINIESNDVLLINQKIIGNGLSGASGLIISGNNVKVVKSEIAENGFNGVAVTDLAWKIGCEDLKISSHELELI